MERLNDYAHFEVFDTIAELVDDGVFVLMSVCTDWQARVLRSPRMWRYITISDNTEDCEAKLYMQLVMSQELPLVVRVHFPLISLWMLEKVLQRVIANLIVITGVSTSGYEKIFEILRHTLVQCPKPQVTRIVWVDSSGDHPYVPTTVQKELLGTARREGTEALEGFIRAHPASLLSCFKVSTYSWKTGTKDTLREIGILTEPGYADISLKTFCLCVHKLKYLVSLSVTYRIAVEPGDLICKVMPLPTLQTLDLNLGLWPTRNLLLIAPRLRQLTLRGTRREIWYHLTTPEHSLHLETLTLHTREDSTYDADKDIDYDSHSYIHSTDDLIFKLDSAERRGITSPSAAFTSMSQLLAALVTRITRLHIHIPIEDRNFLQGIHPAVDIHTVQISDDSRPRQIANEPSLRQLKCETLVLKDARVNLPFDKLPQPRKLILSGTPFSIGDIPPSWMSSLVEMEASNCYNDLSRGMPQPYQEFMSLLCLKCDVRFLVATLRLCELPALEELYIQKGRYLEGDREVEELLSLISSTTYSPEDARVHEVLPRVHTLALDWFPEWKHMRIFLERWVETHETTSIFTLKLPKRPAKPVLGAIVELLSGETPRIPLPGMSGYDKVADIDCRECTLAGWRFEGDCRARHGRVGFSELFIVTKNTEY